jgi:peptide/nickel transport system permease protein
MTAAGETLPAEAAPRRWPGLREWQRQKRRPAGAGGTIGFWGAVWARPGGKLGLLLLAVLVLAALFADLLYPGDPLQTAGETLLWPGQNPDFPLGTDSLGRDVAASLVHGARTSLVVGATAALVSTLVGIVLGALAGYFGGWVDIVVLRVTELFQATPMFLLIVVIVALFQPSEALIAISIGFTTWETIARLVRAEFRQLLHSDFVLAARSQGMGNSRIIHAEILPNVLPSIVVMISFKVATAIFMESGLAFLGLGDPNAVSWGAMIAEGRDFIRSAWYITVVPTIAIVLTVLSLNLLGDTLTEVLNPRLRSIEA